MLPGICTCPFWSCIWCLRARNQVCEHQLASETDRQASQCSIMQEAAAGHMSWCCSGGVHCFTCSLLHYHLQPHTHGGHHSSSDFYPQSTRTRASCSGPAEQYSSPHPSVCRWWWLSIVECYACYSQFPIHVIFAFKRWRTHFSNIWCMCLSVCPLCWAVYPS